ncbi:hypothetical protein ACIBCT_35370 [Streptosporangium sp. NPDC050855]|uniref:hypothetical protein n=1 Tax=Streptosporangium sp. NPDC050855 TaxID=3366194 RepID=UPI00379CFC8F
MRTKEDIERRVKAYLAKAESAVKLGNMEEAKLFFGAVSEMVYTYDLDEAVLRTENNAGKTEITISSHRFQVSNRGQHGPERIEALFSFVGAMNCEGVSIGCARNTYGQPIDFEVLGPAETVDRLKLLIPILLLQMEDAARQSAKKFRKEQEMYYLNPANLSRAVTKWFRSVLVGYGRGVAAKIQERMAKTYEEATEGSTAALVLYDRATALEAALKERWPKLRPSRTRKLYSDALREGQRLGKQADLGDARIGSETRAIPR